MRYVGTCNAGGGAMVRRLWLPMAAAATLAAMTAAGADAAILAPPGFQERVISTAFTQPVAFAEAPDGRIFVAEKRGVVKVVDINGTLSPHSVLDISDHVNAYTDRGLLGIAIDRDFASNGYVYLYYVFENNRADPTGPKMARLSRITVRPDNTVVTLPTAETVILGTYSLTPRLSGACPAPDNLIDCIPADTASHNGGTIRVDDDGTLWVSIGDANLGTHEPHRFRPYDERSYAGKILHVDREGRGLPSHPFCPGESNLAAVCTKLHAKGFRNPFRMTLRGGGRTPLVGDVGQAAREELDAVQPGGNYGWPCYEGDIRSSAFQSTTRCKQEYAKEGTGDASRPPIWSYENPPATGAAIVGGPLYTGTLFPSEYRDQIYVGDFLQGFIKRLTVDAFDRVTAVNDFASGWLGVDLQQLSTGELGYVLIAPHTVAGLTFDADNQIPVARAAASPRYGALPLTVAFDGSGSSDGDGDALTYRWSFGDGTADSTERDPVHVYSTAGRFTVTLRVTDSQGGTATDSLTVWPGNTAPEVTLEAPADGSLYRDGVAVALRGRATDPEDGALADGSLAWDVLLHHGAHVHPFTAVSGEEAEFTPLVDHDADSYYEITLTATDSQGLSVARSVTARPETVDVTFRSDPAGAGITWNGVERSGPFTVPAAVGYRGTVAAADTVTIDGQSRVWKSWSDGGAQVHTLTVPPTDAAYTATYKADTTRPQTTITRAPDKVTRERRGTFEFAADEPTKRFECRLDNQWWWDPCQSPYTTRELKGTHRFHVRAFDLGGLADLSPATYEWTIVG